MRDLQADLEMLYGYREKLKVDSFDMHIEWVNRAIAAEALLARIGGDKTITGLAKSNIDLLDDNQILRKAKVSAEAEVEKLKCCGNCSFWSQIYNTCKKTEIVDKYGETHVERIDTCMKWEWEG